VGEPFLLDLQTTNCSPPQLTLNNTLLAPSPSIDTALQIFSYFNLQYISIRYTASLCARRSSVACNDRSRGARIRNTDEVPAVCAETVQSVIPKHPLARRWWGQRWAPFGVSNACVVVVKMGLKWLLFPTLLGCETHDYRNTIADSPPGE
jgi:hypothetical protein